MRSQHGAKVVLGGKRHARGGNFYEPTILADVTPEMMVAREETFGPVAPLFRFKTEEEVIAMANDTPFGLAAYFYARDVGRVWRVAEALECGIIGINEGIISTEVAPFGGVKEIGPRPRGLPPRRRGVPRDQVHADGRAVTLSHRSVFPPVQRRAGITRQITGLDSRCRFARGNDGPPEQARHERRHWKQQAAERALAFVEDGMQLGLGTGSTAAQVRRSARPARARPGCNVTVRADLGGDARAGRARSASRSPRSTRRRSSISPSTAPTSSTTSCGSSRAAAARCCARRSSRRPRERMIVIADASKRVATLGKFPLPVEVVRFGLAATRNMIEVLAADAGCEGEITLRLGAGRPAVHHRQRQLHPRLRLRRASPTRRRSTRR